MANQNELLRDELAIAFGHILGHELTPYQDRFETTLDVVYAFNLHYADVLLTIEIKDIEGEDIASPTIVLKTGAVIGSGEAVSADETGKYHVRIGTYNYSISKTDYETLTGTVTIEYLDAEVDEKLIQVTLRKPSVVSVSVLDVNEDEVTDTAIVIQEGETIGSGDVLVAEEDGTYLCGVGTYNYSISKEGYETETGTFIVLADDLDRTKMVTITLHEPCVVTIAPVDESELEVTDTTIILKTGEVAGSGTEVVAEADGTYRCGIGVYNYSVAKDTYVTTTGTFEIAVADLDQTKTVTVVLPIEAE